MNDDVPTMAGFTLLELLVVVSILASISFIAATNLQGVDREVDSQLERVELAEVAKAVRQFRADTGYFPKEGPFDYEVHPAAKFDLAQLPVYAPLSTADKQVWFDNAANLSQLTGVGIQSYMETFMPWTSAAARGWRGPYLDSSGEGYVDIGNIVTVSDNPVSGDSVDDVPAIFIGGEKRPQGVYFLSRRIHQQHVDYLNGEVGDLEWAGRPVLMFVEKNSRSIAERVVLVAMGANGEFDGYTVDCEPKVDDQVICIYAD
ncbi:type II secretion system protein [Thiomicrorhabdus heinhorstiae]|uniref:Prepilin-type N-terminal cleavage/methylation domain-containing protein n=1 Tax=Thiomicrorhabdus heinhorstiae TaxID=2748010 RepID=A0ABS0BU72_9GAMM|nr:prepilin-type N-terminal cleavage/methylation domain-containing protein [Thiomicrorhabdus heinhorstiae]MBF6057388.1 prepilin-type N-terminal cleavage/methylation domain-containing protein [Thiomicrorhabdus heinhorstiae]